MSLEQLEETLPSDPAGPDEGAEIAAVEGRSAAVVDDVLPELLVANAAVVHAKRVVDPRLGPHVDHVDVDPRVGAARVDQVTGVGREADELALPEDRHRHADIRERGRRPCTDGCGRSRLRRRSRLRAARGSRGSSRRSSRCEAASSGSRQALVPGGRTGRPRGPRSRGRAASTPCAGASTTSPWRSRGAGRRSPAEGSGP